MSDSNSSKCEYIQEYINCGLLLSYTTSILLGVPEYQSLRVSQPKLIRGFRWSFGHDGAMWVLLSVNKFNTNIYGN